MQYVEIKSFEKSEILENWWQDVHDEWHSNNYHITVICLHPHLVLMHNLDSKLKIAASHDMLVDLDKYDLHELAGPHEKDQLNILIIESDTDLMTLYLEFFTEKYPCGRNFSEK